MRLKVSWMNLFLALAVLNPLGGSLFNVHTGPLTQLRGSLQIADPPPRGRIFIPLVAAEEILAAGPPADPSAPTPDPGAPPTPPTPGAPGQPGSGLFGIDLGTIQVENGLKEMVQAGSRWVRRGNYSWPLVEPEKGERRWEAMAGIDAELSQASQNGLQTILVIQNTPAWARLIDDSACGPVKPEELLAFGRFMHDLVKRYSQPPYNVKHWEITNEPDVPVTSARLPISCWGDTNDPYFGGRYFAEMLKQVYPQVKAADPQAQVLLGGLLLDCDPRNPPPGKDCLPARFLEGILINGGARYFDVLSFHTYDYYFLYRGQYGNPNWSSRWNNQGPALSAKVSYLKELLDKYGASGKPLMNTETALTCTKECDADFERTKAGYVAQSYALAVLEEVDVNFWYDSLGSWRNTGLLGADRKPLPAYYAYQFAQKQFDGAVFVREIDDYKDARVLEFSQGSRRFWLLWAQVDQAHTIALPAAPRGAWDVQGSPLPVQANLSLGPLPVYLEW